MVAAVLQHPRRVGRGLPEKRHEVEIFPEFERCCRCQSGRRRPAGRRRGAAISHCGRRQRSTLGPTARRERRVDLRSAPLGSARHGDTSHRAGSTSARAARRRRRRTKPHRACTSVRVSRKARAVSTMACAVSSAGASRGVSARERSTLSPGPGPPVGCAKVAFAPRAKTAASAAA